METALETETKRTFIVLNPVAGSAPANLREQLEQAFGGEGRACTIHETKPNENLAAQIEHIRNDGYDLVIAAGGDGTVSLVASCLSGSEVPLGILPVGTANVLALELGIPGDISQAIALLQGEHRLRQLDMMQLGDRYFILQIGIGIDSLMIKDTGRQAKRLFGRLAYMSTLIGKIFGYQSQRFTILVDDKRIRPRAWQVMVANAGTLGIPPLRWGPDIHPTDGELDLCIFNVRTPLDYLRLIWLIAIGRHKHGSNISYMRIRNHVTITTDRQLPVQADGEIIGETPVRISVIPRGITVVVPQESKPQPTITVAREADARDE